MKKLKNRNFRFSDIVIIFSFIILFFPVSSYSQYWMYGGGSYSTDEAMCSSKDAVGNIYTAGYFGGSITLSGINLISSGVSDILLMKHNSGGTLQWAVKAGGFAEDRALSAVSDNSGNTYITGFFYGTATFNSQTLTSSGSYDIFIAKYNSSGNFQWAKRAGGTQADISNSITLDSDGNILLAGQYMGTASFDSYNITSLVNQQSGLDCINSFLAKYDSNGNCIWVKNGQSDDDCRTISVASDNSNNIYVTGQFSDTLDFGVSHNNNINNAIYLIKFDSDGNELWYKRIGASLHNVAYSITTDSNEDVIITGEAHGTLYFFNSTTYSLSNTYPYQAFLAKYSSSGDFEWAVSDGSESFTSSQVVKVGSNNDIFISGNFQCKFSEYADEFGQGTFNSIGYNDIFVAKYDTDGQRLWMRNFGSQKNDNVHGMIIYNNKPVLSGSYSKSLIIPVSSNISVNNFLNISYHSPNPINLNFCGDNTYGYFKGLYGYPSSDFFVMNAIDLNREPYDYYYRSGSVCDRPYVGSCIVESDLTSLETNIGCGDSAVVCDTTYLHVCTNTSERYFSSYRVGPNFTYLWSTGANTRSILTTVTDNYVVTVTTEDGCFETIDTFNLVVNISPEIPWISDDHGVGNNSCIPYHM
ncbi:MAG: SBBP repeat-containing protein [Bacteroidota bacterium]